MPNSENIATLPATCKARVAADAVVIGAAEYAFLGYLQEHHPNRKDWEGSGI